MSTPRRFRVVGRGTTTRLTLSLTRGPKPGHPLKVTLALRNIVSADSSGTGAVQSTEIGLTEADRQTDRCDVDCSVDVIMVSVPR